MMKAPDKQLEKDRFNCVKVNSHIPLVETVTRINFGDEYTQKW